MTSGQRARCCSSSAGPCVAPAAGSSASRPTVAAACAGSASLACAHTIHRTAARRLRAHASEAAQQPSQQPGLIGRPVQLVRGSLRLGPLAVGAHEEIGHQTVVSEPYRAASTAAFVVAQTRREGALRVSSNSPPVDASCLPLHPRDPLRSTLARQRRFWASRSVQYGLISLRWPARAHICTL